MNTAPKLLSERLLRYSNELSGPSSGELVALLREAATALCDLSHDDAMVRQSVEHGWAAAALAPPSGEGVDAGLLLRDPRNFRPVAWEHQCSGGRCVLSYIENDERIDDVHRVRPLLYSDTIRALVDATTPQAAPVGGDADQPAGGWDAVDADNGFRRYPWTYQNQPGNVGASVLGGACNQASAASAGDTIDRGLGLLKALHERGFGIVRVPKIAVQDTTPPPASQERGDREVLLYLMQQFDCETWECEQCGHSEDCKTMDSAEYLRSYLAASPPGLHEAGCPLSGTPNLYASCDCGLGATEQAKLVAINPVEIDSKLIGEQAQAGEAT